MEWFTWTDEKGDQPHSDVLYPNAEAKTDTFRIVTHNVLYTAQRAVHGGATKAADDTGGATAQAADGANSTADRIIRFVQGRRARVRVLIYCDHTLQQATELANKYSDDSGGVRVY